jgi:hypothetical protein
MSEVSNQNHPSKSEHATRVKVNRKEPKKTVGITLTTYIIEEARNRKLNLSRIAEQALLSIPEYYPQQTETESSISLLSRGCFPKEERARSSARLERQAHNLLVKGSNPFGPT